MNQTCETPPELATEPTRHKKSKLKLNQEFMSEIIADEKDRNNEIFLNYYFWVSESIALSKNLNWS